MIRRRILSLLSVAAISILAACGGSSTNVQNPPPPPPSQLAVAFQPAPVASLLIGSTADLTAVVTDDPGNYGVDWLLTCPTGNGCGSLSTLHSDSGAAVTYSPPQNLPKNTQSVTITAFATADHTKNVVAPITLSAFASSLSGTYILQTKGTDANLQPYQMTSVLVLDGNGGITFGQQILNYVAGSLATSIHNTSTYFIGPDGRGSLTINTVDQNRQPLTETFGLVVLSKSQAFISELDSPQSSTGTLELQTSRAMPSGGYAFVLSGTDVSGTPTGMGGIFNIDSPGNISGAGSLADQDYYGTLLSCPATNGLFGTVTQPTPNPFGKVTLTLTGANCFGSIVLTGFIVDATHIRLIETDNDGSAGFSTAGIAIAQGSSAGTFKTASFSGNYVFGILGTDIYSGVPSSFTSAGVVSADGSGVLTSGITDTFMLVDALGAPGQISSQFDGTYKMDTKGIGRARLFLSHFNPPPHPGFRPGLIFYLTGNGRPPLVLDAGGEDPNYPSLGVGIAYPQATVPVSFSGKLGFGFTQQNYTENDGIGQMTAAASSLTGAVTDSANGVGTSVALTDASGSPDSHGRVTGTFLGTNVVYYLIDANHGFFVETDVVNPGSGQLGFGQFGPRSPVCASCP
ncbi:MAG TPA: hypothetical protein VFE61_13930 [Candidatus Sulfotelmatobacter sp.]|nr:hypothetical protein [Candidatus Sulfotelmatobacter sp.]